MALGAINLVTVPVTDQDRAKKFYVETLGFEEKFDYVMAAAGAGGGSRWVMLTPPNGGPDITLASWFGGDKARPGSAKLSITCDDVDATWAQLNAVGVPVHSAVEDAPWGRWFGFDDPDGNNWLVVQQS
ncbi:VOC family protein [Micromonospora zhanjiangensis]|uniref:VOC family protein n=1 Tax=Micromonospora zhanjiangensis TaxID=1522057 RepID=A0ABV8KSZ4_9ACTN